VQTASLDGVAGAAVNCELEHVVTGEHCALTVSVASVLV
jgi:hypothetical protein